MDQPVLIYHENKARWLSKDFTRSKTKERKKKSRVRQRLEMICYIFSRKAPDALSAGGKVLLVYIPLSCHPFFVLLRRLGSSTLPLISALIFKTPNEMNIKRGNRFNSSPVIMFGPRKQRTPACSPPRANLIAIVKLPTNSMIHLLHRRKIITGHPEISPTFPQILRASSV